MKAKDYYAFYQKIEATDGSRKATEGLILKLCHDCSELMTIRKVKEPNAIKSCVEQFNSIWNAIRKLDPSFRRDGFLNFMTEKAKELMIEDINKNVDAMVADMKNMVKKGKL